jgi:DNA modification methylase
MEDYTNRILQGNNFEVLDTLPEKIFHTCVTSPPYWGLRNYHTIPQIWPNPENVMGEQLMCQTHEFEMNQSLKRTGGKNGKMTNTKKQRAVIDVQTGFCKKCGAWKGELGLEPSPELYIQHLVMICRKVWRVLRDDGTFWLNLGDSYWGSGGSTGHTPETKNLGRKTFEYGAYPSGVNSQQKHPFYKPKDLCMIPARVAIALQEDG